MKFKVQVLKETFAVCQLTEDDILPMPPTNQFWSYTCTRDEISLVCDQEVAPSAFRIEKGWKGIQLLGKLDFDQIGVIASFCKILADAAIPIYVISTYNTDYIFVKDTCIQSALEVLVDANLILIESHT